MQRPSDDQRPLHRPLIKPRSPSSIAHMPSLKPFPVPLRGETSNEAGSRDAVTRLPAATACQPRIVKGAQGSCNADRLKAASVTASRQTLCMEIHSKWPRKSAGYHEVPGTRAPGPTPRKHSTGAECMLHKSSLFKRKMSWEISLMAVFVTASFPHFQK